MKKKLFHQVVSELVDRQRRIRSEKREYIASKINCSESYLRKIHSFSTDKHYSLEQLYILSEHWGINISQLIPSISNLKLLQAYKCYSEKELEKLMIVIGNSIKEDKNESIYK